MAEETAGRHAAEAGRALSPARPLALIKQHQAALVATALAVLAFCVFRYFGSPESPYNNFVILADAFLDGHVDITNGAVLEAYIEFAINDGKYYISPPPWPAVMMLPAVAIWGLDLNQTLVSAIVGGLTTGVVYLISRRFTDSVASQIWLTALAIFGTVFWHAAANGGVWFFSHTVAVLFLFLAVYFTLIKRHPLLAGLCLGAAFWTRQPTVLTIPFFVIMFSDLWLKPATDGLAPWKRVNLRPLVEFGSGLGMFVLLSFGYNLMRFGTPLDASQHHLPERVLAQPWFDRGPFDVRYITRHVVVLFEFMPLVSSQPPYFVLSTGGMAIWATTPAFLIALFNRVRDPRVLIVGIALALIAVGIPLVRAISGLWDSDWYDYRFPSHINILPFYILIAAALWFSRRDKFALACWAAILPTALMLFTFAGTGFAQFGYRFSLDYMPFLFLLTAHTIGNDMKWHHKLLILLSVFVNFMGILWSYHLGRADSPVFEVLPKDDFIDKTWVVP
jgi:hypothetical protein